MQTFAKQPKAAHRTRDNSGHPTLTLGRPGDAYEQEADRLAERVTRMPEPVLQRACACGGQCPACRVAHMEHAQAHDAEPAAVPPIVYEVLRSPGQPLDAATRGFMEPRFGRDFSGVRVHASPLAARSAAAVAAHAYTVGSDVVFGAGRYAPGLPEGRWLLAHELSHVAQQDASSRPARVLQRSDGFGMSGADADAAAEREYGDKGAPKARKCAGPDECPPGFCDPYRSQPLAEYYRSKDAWWLMAGIALAVNSRVVPLWREYLWGGSAPKNLTGDFAKDFTDSPTTKKSTVFLYGELKKSLAAAPPSLAVGNTVMVTLGAQIPAAIAALQDPSSVNQMNFSFPRDIPGNLAGGIGTDESACPAGAQPSPFNDARTASGIAIVTRTTASELAITPLIAYTVKDTIDLCPGDCGTAFEQVATVALSQFEATGISGDVPFTVDFLAPALGPFTVSAPLSKTPAPAPAPPPAAASPAKKP